ncbi:AMP-binding protein [Marinicella rhabdoformis]|uniref:AMP-binding protein n=1 Tax=Marinicella rhabdoformis TaxID=2580566 RepID=UPI0015CFCBF0|nr:AMP-binding protein [Marinicella rhabdoformis]
MTNHLGHKVLTAMQSLAKQSPDQCADQHVDQRLNQRLVIHLDNSEAWLQIDAYATELDWVIIPVPYFFSISQIQHLIQQAGVSAIVCDSRALPLYQQLGFQLVEACESGLYLLHKTITELPKLPEGTHKITYTSGTTNEPKGVCLSEAHLAKVGHSLAQATRELGLTKHLSLLPYSVLLENMAATYANQFAGLEIISLPLSQIGMTGSGKLDIVTMTAAIVEHQADSLIMMPQMLKELISYLTAHPIDLGFIKFIAVGGAVCSPHLIQCAHDMGLPVYQGYGISECGSVICLNTEKNAVYGVGKALPHCDIQLAEDGEVLVKGPRFLGYLGCSDYLIQGHSKNHNNYFSTGDIGTIDKAGHLNITGRKKNTIINSFGRNILPDWLEGELLAIPGVHQAVIYGEAKPFLTALCVTQLSKPKLQQAVDRLNQTLPDYARIIKTITIEPFTIQNGQLTSSGKTKHKQIFKTHKNTLEKIYATRTEIISQAI